MLSQEQEASSKHPSEVNAHLAASADSYAACNGKIFTVSYALRGDADLTSDCIRFELIDLQASKAIPLDSTRTRSSTIDLIRRSRRPEKPRRCVPCPL